MYNRAKNSLLPVGCPFKGLEEALTAVLRTMEQLMTFDTAHRGGTPVTRVGRWQRPISESNHTILTQLEWFDGKRCTLELEYQAITDTRLHNSQNIPEAMLFVAVERICPGQDLLLELHQASFLAKERAFGKICKFTGYSSSLLNSVDNAHFQFCGERLCPVCLQAS